MDFGERSTGTASIRRSGPPERSVARDTPRRTTETKEVELTAKADFTEEEWKQVLEGPPSAGMVVMTAQRGGTIRESFSMAKSYTEARKEHGESELLDELTAAKPEIDHTRFRTVEELKAHCLDNVRQGLQVLRAKATPEELDQYKRFIADLSERVAEAHREGFLGLSGERVSDDERDAIAEVNAVLEGAGS
jgi:hypothetical protein